MMYKTSRFDTYKPHNKQKSGIGRDLNPQQNFRADYESNALTTRPHWLVVEAQCLTFYL